MSGHRQGLVLVLVKCKYTHRSLFAGLYFVVLQMHEVSPRIKVHHLNPLVDGSIRIVQQFEQVFQPYHIVLKILKEIKRHLLSQFFSKERKNTNSTVALFVWRAGPVNYAWSLALHGGILVPNPCKKQGMNVLHYQPTYLQR